MKYHSGQTVTLLDTDYKPAGSAVIIRYEEITDKYEVDFKYPDNKTTGLVHVPEDRLILPAGFIK